MYFLIGGPFNPDRRLSNASEPSAASILAAAVPLVERPGPGNRLDSMIRQSTGSNSNDPSATYYNVSPGRTRQPEPTPFGYDDEKPGQIKTTHLKPNRSPVDSRRSSATSSMRVAENVTPENNYSISAKNPTVHQSLELLPRTSQTDTTPRPLPKSLSEEIHRTPVQPDIPEPFHVTPRIGSYPASQFPSAAKGVLRKRNPGIYK